QQKLVVAALAEELTADPASPVLGNPKGDVTVVEFSDYRCGYCKSVHPTLMELLKRDGNVRLVIKEFPILGPESVEAAKAALAANRQGKFAAVNERLMAFKGQLTRDAILQVAREAGVDVKRLQADMEAPEIMQALQRNRKLASKLEINGTPGFVIGQKVVPGAIPLEQFEELVKAARARL
ncbi:MAG: DsbA family protein, partial [Alphaproteobacteria bacterium]|nr:DsbA family protein [Alphaproteobacteria bacterium]